MTHVDPYEVANRHHEVAEGQVHDRPLGVGVPAGISGLRSVRNFNLQQFEVTITSVEYCLYEFDETCNGPVASSIEPSSVKVRVRTNHIRKWPVL